MNLLDLLLLVGLVSAAVRGYRRGALSQVAGFGGAVLGLVLGAALAPRVAGLFVQEPGATLALVTLGALLGFVLLGQGLGFSVGLRLRTAVADVGAAPVDRMAGVLVGVAGLLLTVWFLSATLAQGPIAPVSKQIRESRVVDVVAGAMPPPPDVFSRVAAYLDRQGFPQVFAGVGGATAPPVDPPGRGAVAAAVRAGEGSTVQIQATGCGGVSSGTGFVPRSGFVVTNAHVVAGGEAVDVRDLRGLHSATVIHFDPGVDLAVLAVPGLQAPALPWASQPAVRETAGATLGYPGGRSTLVVEPAAVRGRGRALGRDIYGRDTVTRDILTLRADVERGDSGGPFVTAGGEVAGVVFAAAAAEPDTGYALTAESVRPDVAAAITDRAPVGTGGCRF